MKLQEPASAAPKQSWPVERIRHGAHAMMPLRFKGPLSRFGLAAALAFFVIDQAHKWWMLQIYDITAKSPVKLAPILDLVLVWNRGISYGLFQQHSTLGRWALIGFTVLVLAVLAVWLARTHVRLPALALGLVIGGALSNLADRLIHGAVADFFHFHVYGFSWYVFNLADAVIVAGVAGLLYDSFHGRHKSASNGL